MAILTEQRERRDAQPIPTEATEAAEKFVCGVYRCNLSGKTCRDYHAQAKITRSMAREACIDCAAGAARLVLLGDGETPGLAAICLERTAKGAPCTNPPIKSGYCHIHRKDRIQMPAPKKAPAAKPAARAERPQAPRPEPARKSPAVAPKKPARAPLVVDVPVDVEVAVEVSVVAPPAPMKIDMVVAKADVVCRRPSCGRPAPGTGKLGEYCRQCANAAYMTLKKGTKGVPTDEDRRKWLEQTPVNHRLRESLAKARRGEPTAPSVDEAVAVVVEAAPPAVEPVTQQPETPITPAEASPVAVVVEDVAVPAATPPKTRVGMRTPPPGSKGIDLDAQPLGKLSDTALGETLGCSATAVRFQRQRRNIPPFTPSPSKSTTFAGKKRMPRHKARLAIGEHLCKALGVKQPPHFDLVESGAAEWAFCILPDRDTLSHLHPDGRIVFRGTAWVPGSVDAPPTAPMTEPTPAEPAITEEPAAVEPPTRAGIGFDAIPLTPSEVPAHLVVIMLPLNRRAFAELERLAAAGLDGDDPTDVARTLVLEGLRRRAAVRP